MLGLSHASKTRRFNSVNKSNTAVALPGIHKTVIEESNNSKHKSNYLDTVSYLSQNIDY